MRGHVSDSLNHSLQSSGYMCGYMSAKTKPEFQSVQNPGSCEASNFVERVLTSGTMARYVTVEINLGIPP